MKYKFKTQGTCSQMIEFDMENGIVSNIVFHGGCNGNLKGIASLCEGKPVTEIIERLEGIRCGFKITSCPDQLAKALKKNLKD